MFTYYPSTKKNKLSIDSVVLIIDNPLGDSVLLKTTDTDLIFLYPSAKYGFRVKSLNADYMKNKQLYEEEIRSVAEYLSKSDNKSPFYITEKYKLDILLDMGFEQVVDYNVNDLDSGLLANKIIYEPETPGYSVSTIDLAIKCRCIVL